jgi:hypothetical protein
MYEFEMIGAILVTDVVLEPWLPERNRAPVTSAALTSPTAKFQPLFVEPPACPRQRKKGENTGRGPMFELLLAYTFIGLFSGVVLFGHVLLIRDIFFAGSPTEISPGQPDKAASDADMREAA